MLTFINCSFLHYENWSFSCISGVNVFRGGLFWFWFSGVTPKCCVETTKKFPLEILLKVTKYEVQTSHGVCSIDALVWVIDDMSYWVMSFWRMVINVRFLLSDSTLKTSDTVRHPNSSDSCRSYWSRRCSTAWNTPLLFEQMRSTQTSHTSLFNKTVTRCFCLHGFLSSN